MEERVYFNASERELLDHLSLGSWKEIREGAKKGE